MSSLRPVLPLFASLSLSANLYAQDVNVPGALPANQEEFIQSEKFVLLAIDWLETTPFNQRSKQRKLVEAYLTAWVTNAPTVTIELNSNVIPLGKKNPDLLVVFMGGWTRYTLQNAYSKDPVQCNLAGLKSLVRVYGANVGRGIRKDEAVQKLDELDKQGALEHWVREQLGKKS